MSRFTRKAKPHPRHGSPIFDGNDYTVDIDRVLKTCRDSAKKSFNDSEPIFDNVECVLKMFDNALASTIEKHKITTNEIDADTRKHISKFLAGSRKKMGDRFNLIKQSHLDRSKRLNEFTVMMFGKTMAGKSTTIGALANLDRSVVGDGSPDHTRDITRHISKGVTYVDTPGLFGFKENLRGEAERYIDRSDLICMVVSDDTIEPDLFEKMHEMRGQNKQIVILFNDKSAFDRIINRRKQPFNDTTLVEWTTEIQRRLKEAFHKELINVIPYCAQAAFEARHESNIENAKYLWETSRIEHVLKYVSQVIKVRGTAIRSTSAFDSLAYFVQTIAEDLENDLPPLKNQRELIRVKKATADKLFEKLDKQSRDEIGIFNKHFNNVERNIPDLCWSFVRGENNNSLTDDFNKICCWQDLNTIRDQYHQDVVDRLKRNNQRFFEDLGQDMAATIKITNSDVAQDEFQTDIDLDRGSIRRWIGRKTKTYGKNIAGAGASFGAGALLYGSLAASGPIGWLGLLAIGVGSFVAAKSAVIVTKKTGEFIEDSGLDAQNSAHADLSKALLEKLSIRKSAFIDSQASWATELINNTKIRILRSLELSEDAASRVVNSGESVQESMHEARRRLSYFSYDVLLKAAHPAFNNGKAQLINATQWMGYRAKLLVRSTDGSSIFGLLVGCGGENIRQLQSYSGNQIDIVELKSDNLVTEDIISKALRPAQIDPKNVRAGPETSVMLEPDKIGAAFGRRRRNLILAEELLNIRIRLKVLKGDNNEENKSPNRDKRAS